MRLLSRNKHVGMKVDLFSVVSGTGCTTSQTGAYTPPTWLLALLRWKRGNHSKSVGVSPCVDHASRFDCPNQFADRLQLGVVHPSLYSSNCGQRNPGFFSQFKLRPIERRSPRTDSRAKDVSIRQSDHEMILLEVFFVFGDRQNAFSDIKSIVQVTLEVFRGQNSLH